MAIKSKFSDDAPDNVTDMSQKMAWSFGYNAALNTVIDALKVDDIQGLNRMVQDRIAKSEGPVGDIVHVPDIAIQDIASFGDKILDKLRESLGQELVDRFNYRNSTVTVDHLMRVVGLPEGVQLDLLIRVEQGYLTVFQLQDLVKEYRTPKKD